MPIYFMLYSNTSDNKTNYYVIFSYLIACLILNIAVGVCFEYYKEIIKKSNVDFKLVGVGKLQFAFAQGIYYFILNSWVIILDLIILFYLKPFDLKNYFAVIDLFYFLSFNCLFLVAVCGVSSFLAYFVEKTKIFSVGSLFCNFMLIFSGSYTPMQFFPPQSYILFYINPFYYYVNGLQSIVFGTDLPFSHNIFLFLDLINVISIVLIINVILRKVEY